MPRGVAKHKQTTTTKRWGQAQSSMFHQAFLLIHMLLKLENHHHKENKDAHARERGRAPIEAKKTDVMRI